LSAVDHVDVRVERLVAGGRGLARLVDGRVAFVEGALPGELVRAEVVGTRRDFAEADTVEVLEASPARVEPPCPMVALGCGGCSWQHVDPVAQAALKADIVRDALRRTGHLPEATIEVAPALPTERFRTTLRMAVDDAGRSGFRRRSSHDVVPVERCLVAHPALDDLVGRPYRGVTEVTMRASAATGERTVSLRHGDGPIAEPPPEASARAIHEYVDGVRLKVSARSFFQTRADGAHALVDQVRAATGVGSAGRIVDAYAGVGLFAATVGRDASVTAIERSPSSCRDARENLAGRAKVIEGDVARWRATPADVVVADPSRQGLGRTGVEALVAARPSTFVLVSCDPVSLARDTALLREHRFVHRRSVVVDLFPHTPHVETVTTFERS
jgi:23S rRNA (uracil1939-C5)-methyltransferase